jgi:predicted nucleic acid-binding protein
MELIADTTVLIDLWRYGSKRNRISDLAVKAGDASLVIPWITQAEFSRGALSKGIKLTELETFYSGFLLLALDQKTMDCYCNLWVAMAGKGKAPDYPDLWIAACAVARGIPVITRNPKHFSQIPELEIVAYELKG